MLNFIHQMQEYGSWPGATIVPQAAPRTKKAVPAFAALESRYKLPDHPIFSQATSTLTSYEKEFDLYTTDHLSPVETDLVTFWQVIDYMCYLISAFNELFLKGSSECVPQNLSRFHGLSSNPSLLCSMRACFFISRGN